MRAISRIPACIIGVFLLASTGSAYAYFTGSEYVSGSRTTPQYGDSSLLDNAGNPGPFGPYSWNYAYIRSFDGVKLAKHVEINFVFDAGLGYTDAQKAAYKSAVEANVEGIWNDKFWIEDNDSGDLFALTVDLTTDGSFNQTVAVHAGSGRADMLNWYVDDIAATNAHEFGHMLGLFDEYIGGAVDKYPKPTLTDVGVMGLGALSANPVMYARYYQQYLDFMNVLNPGHSFALVPEPSVLALLSIGIILMALARQHVRTRSA